jgi:K+-sensing histidine kinase KdpD
MASNLPITRGRLRVYLGYAPGGSTTCTLLCEGQRRAGYEDDVVVARVQRWQDVQALLVAGIDVISTVGIGHLASLADVVEKIIGVLPAQTVPDPVVRAAAEIELVDAAPPELRQRMAAGHIYPAPEAAAALDSWFCSPNLSVLRELALRWLAATLISGSRRCRSDGGVPGDGPTREKVIVAVGTRRASPSTRSPQTPRPPHSATGSVRRSGRRSRARPPPGPASPAHSARSHAPTAPPRPPTTGTPSTPTSRTLPPARPRATASMHPAGSGTR